MKQLTIAIFCLAVAAFVGPCMVSTSIKNKSTDEYRYLSGKIDELDKRGQQIIDALSGYDPAFTSARFLNKATGHDDWLSSATWLGFTDWKLREKIERRLPITISREKQDNRR